MAKKRKPKRRIRTAKKPTIKPVSKQSKKRSKKPAAKKRGRAPAGFYIPKSKPTLGKQREVEDGIKFLLSNLEEGLDKDKNLEGSNINTYSHINRDGSVDGQLTISGLSRGVSGQDILRAISENSPEQGYPEDLWVSIGFRWPLSGDDDDERYDHFRGLNQTMGYPRSGRALQTHIRDVIDMADKVGKAGWRKPTHIIYRINWNPEVKQPKKLKKGRPEAVWRTKVKGHGKKR